MTTGKSKERKNRISKANMLTLWENISDELFESDSGALLKRPDFFFGDAITGKIGSCVTETISGSAR